MTKDEIDYARSSAEALRRFEAGEKVEASTGIHDGTTYGYGELDDNGFFEFPLFKLEQFNDR